MFQSQDSTFGFLKTGRQLKVLYFFDRKGFEKKQVLLLIVSLLQRHILKLQTLAKEKLLRMPKTVWEPWHWFTFRAEDPQKSEISKNRIHQNLGLQNDAKCKTKCKTNINKLLFFRSLGSLLKRRSPPLPCLALRTSRDRTR